MSPALVSFRLVVFVSFRFFSHSGYTFVGPGRMEELN
jgi:hypothetical protein